ncbi:MAG TPA: calcium-binding protein [Nocardioides sp.]|uniref:calcium-binding protein n=1 Tax=Nocardioides sp. TaxID=35761 RepID=UPI002BFB9796|nr:calcium-binding protein [Nocardioides sp.]HTW13916.1 calcium-binding protein [Nocardioides sp.]
MTRSIPRSARSGGPTALAVAGVVVAAGLVVTAVPAAAAVETCEGQVATIVATEHDQEIRGTEGPDVISTAGFYQVRVDARGGDDLVCTRAGTSAEAHGGAGEDTLADSRGPLNPNLSGDSTYLSGGAGDDRIVGIPGIPGYVGVDATIVDFGDATAAVTIRLDTGTATGSGVGRDELVSTTAASGSTYADTFIGSPGDDYYDTGNDPDDATILLDDVRTGAGDDVVEGIRGSVRLGAGDDEADLDFSRIWGEAGDDVLNISIKGFARGGGENDTVRGNSDYEENYRPKRTWVRMYGGPGADLMVLPGVVAEGDPSCPKVCGRGSVNGGSGIDRLRLTTSQSVVDLAAGTGRSRSGRGQLRSLERVIGSNYADIVRGSERDDVLGGGGGRDVLIGRGGDDILIGGKSSRDRADGGAGRDRCRQVEIRRSC